MHDICSGMPPCIMKIPEHTYNQYSPSPETVESIFLAYRLTGHNRYREYGWNIFKNIEEHCRIQSGGYATIVNVDEVPVKHEDKMETFFMVIFFNFLICSLALMIHFQQSETLKYLFLLFEDSDVLPLDST